MRLSDYQHRYECAALRREDGILEIRLHTGDGPLSTPANWDKIYREGKRLLQRLLDIDVPMIAAINGPARMHAELALLCDVVLAADTAVLQDAAHYVTGSVPGDGVHVVWPLLLGPNRGRAFLMTRQELDALEAQRLGVVHEVLPAAELLDRAWRLARSLLEVPELTRRYTRIALVQPIKQAMLEQLGHGLLLEGASIGAAAAARARSAR